MTTTETNEVTIEKLVYGGDGLARLDGRVVLTPFVLPGEKALVASEQSKPDLLRARIVELKERSVSRVEPGCPYFGTCGGCHYQHASYEYQLAQKEAILREVLKRVGKLTAPESIGIISSEPWGYRNRTQFHLKRGKIGFLAGGTHNLVPVDHCPISSPRINMALQTLREMIRDSRFPNFISSMELFTNEDQVQVNVLDADRPVAKRFFEWCAEMITGAAEGSLEYENLRVSHGSFFQVNRFLIGKLVEEAIGDAAGETALDLYAGVGLFSLPLARRFRRVTAVESTNSATTDLAFNAERAGVRVDIAKQPVEYFLAAAKEPTDFVLADPPRAGLGKRAIEQLVRLKPRNITLVACDPATLARDLGPLTAAGYGISKMTIVDLFPQTYHLECVVHLGLI